MTKISMIAAIGKNRELGKNNGLLWNIPEDMKFFQTMSLGHAMVMGRKTFESFRRPLKNRTSIIVTREKDYIAPPGCYVFDNIEKAIEFGKKEEERLRSLDPNLPPEVYIIGGGQIFAAAMPYADRLYLTSVDKEFPDTDTFFPEYPEFTKIVSERKSSDENYKYSFITLEKGYAH